LTIARLWLLGVMASLLIAAPASDPTPAQASEAVPLVMLAGDSVPKFLVDDLERRFAREGWAVVEAAMGGCGVVPVRIVYDGGRTLASGELCPDVVPPWQAQALDRDPDVVVWWDRFSLADFLTTNGEYVQAGTTRFWTLRKRQLASYVDRFSAQGATVVLLATEPVGQGIYTRCTPEACHPWHQRRIERADWLDRWNHILRTYAATHPDQAVYRSINSRVCRDSGTPCDDRLPSGELARPDGTHYSDGAGEALAANALALRLRSVVSETP
jgi:hypothetical protein